MLLRPKRLPRRFNRRVSPATQSFVERRHKRHREQRKQKWRQFSRKFSLNLAVLKMLLRQWALVIGIGIVLLVIGMAFFSPILQVREITVQRGEGRVDVPKIQRSLLPFFGQHLLFVSAHEVTQAIKNVVSDVDTVTVKKEFPSRLVIGIHLQKLVARLSLVEPQKLTNTLPSAPASASGSVKTASGAAVQTAPMIEQHDYLTEKGIYITSPSDQLGKDLPIIRIVDWAVRPVPEKELVTEGLLKRMGQAETILKEQYGLKIDSRTIYLRAQEFHLAAGKQSIWFDMRSSLDQQIARYRVFLQSIGMKNVSQYVDLRLAGRIVYR